MLEARRGGGWVAGKVDINTWDIRDVADAQVYTHTRARASTHTHTHTNGPGCVHFVTEVSRVRGGRAGCIFRTVRQGARHDGHSLPRRGCR